MLMGKEAFKDDKVVHLEDEADKVSSHSGYRTWAKSPWVHLGVAQLIECLPTMHEALRSSLSTTHNWVQ